MSIGTYHLLFLVGGGGLMVELGFFSVDPLIFIQPENVFFFDSLKLDFFKTN